MSSTSASLHPDLGAAFALARLLERIERQPLAVTPAQYRLVAERLGAALEQAPAGAELEALLAASPIATELYENRRYELAGLCRSPLEAALNAELQARDALRKAALA